MAMGVAQLVGDMMTRVDPKLQTPSSQRKLGPIEGSHANLCDGGAAAPPFLTICARSTMDPSFRWDDEFGWG